MSFGDFAIALRLFRPIVRSVGGCHTLVSLTYDWTEEGVRKEVERRNGDFKETERLLNRCFIVSDLLGHLNFDEWHSVDLNRSARDLVGMAQLYADLLRAELARTFPGQKFEIVISGDHLAAFEPLELYVTFSRAL
jgi:hypothetical protein